MEITEQPGTQERIENPGGDNLDSILEAGLKEKNANPEAGVQTDEGTPDNQPETPEKVAEELFGELIVSDAQKLPFKTKEELESLIEKNRELFGKTSHFLRQSDYTRKTQELAKERQEFEDRKTKDDELWGEVKPDENSMGAFRNLWSVFQYASPQVQQKIDAFMQDVSLMASGKPPAGPLAQEAGSQSESPEVISLRQKVAQMERSMQKDKTEAQKEEERKGREQANKDWESWVQKMEKPEKGEPVKITEELSNAMVPYLLALRESDMDNISKCDRAYKLACQELGLDSKQAVKEVYASAGKAKKNSSLPPTSKTSSSQEPEPKDLDGILNQGLKQIRK